MISIARGELAERYRAWSSEDLVRAATIEPHEYTAEALELINSELERRNCSAPQRQGLLETVTEKTDAEARNLTGVRGFLAYMIVAIAVNSIAVLARAGSIAFQGSPLLTSWVFIIIGACLGAFGLVVCAFLIGRDQRAPHYAAIWFLLNMTFSRRSVLPYSSTPTFTLTKLEYTLSLLLQSALFGWPIYPLRSE